MPDSAQCIAFVFVFARTSVAMINLTDQKQLGVGFIILEVRTGTWRPELEQRP